MVKDECGGICNMGDCSCDMVTMRPKSHEEMRDHLIKRGGVLVKALKLINGERRTVYGEPEMSFPKIAKLWSAYLNARFDINIDLMAKDVALIMTLYKIAREVNGYKDDNWVDMAGYIGLGGDLTDE